jgi:hypothetical protein
MGNRQQSQEASTSPFPYEVSTTTELAERLKVKESWVVDQSKRSRTSDPIPIFRLGKHRRYLWGRRSLTRGYIAGAVRHRRARRIRQKVDAESKREPPW